MHQVSQAKKDCVTHQEAEAIRPPVYCYPISPHLLQLTHPTHKQWGPRISVAGVEPKLRAGPVRKGEKIYARKGGRFSLV